MRSTLQVSSHRRLPQAYQQLDTDRAGIQFPGLHKVGIPNYLVLRFQLVSVMGIELDIETILRENTHLFRGDVQKGPRDVRVLYLQIQD